MRFIDTASILAPNNWLTLAVQANIRPRWSFFKPQFEALVNKKCWYSESDNTGATNPIDHFRPKANHVKMLTSKIADLEDAVWNSIDASIRTGYPFMEFEFNNYRYSCAFSNSLNTGTNGKAKGKSNFFPLKSGSPYASSLATLNNEEICLLDPCVSADPSLLTFTNTGYVQANLSVQYGSWEYSKVMVSIEIYHLHYSRFIEKRLILWNSCKEHIELADGLFRKTNKNVDDLTHIAYHIKHLRQKIAKTYEFSATAIDCLSYYLSNTQYNWLTHYFNALQLTK